MNLTEVLLNDGKVIKRQTDFAPDVLDLPQGQFPIARKSPISLTVTNKGKKVLEIEGGTSLEVLMPCDRCLKEVSTPVDISFDFEVDMKLSDEARVKALDESDFLHGSELDTDALIQSEALMALPAKVLCREECKGLCPVCGQDLNIRDCGCDRSVPDPRMAKIRDLFHSMN